MKVEFTSKTSHLRNFDSIYVGDLFAFTGDIASGCEVVNVKISEDFLFDLVNKQLFTVDERLRSDTLLVLEGDLKVKPIR